VEEEDPMSWEAVTAISTAVIAVMVLAASVGFLVLMREVRSLTRGIQRVADSLEGHAQPVLDSVKKVVDDATEVMAAVKSEADGFVDSVRDVRGGVNALVGRVEERLQDLDALIDVLQYEVEETALDIAAAMRTTRRGTTVLRAMKRAFLGRGR
jgi:uncharacterized protein YoxC